MRKSIQFNSFGVVFLITFLAIGLIPGEPTVFADCLNCPTITGEVDYSGAIDSASTPATLGVDACVTVEVNGANPPFQVSIVEGSGVSITQINDNEYEICDTGNACGTIVAGVVDAKGLSDFVEIMSDVGVQEEVECPDGQAELREENEISTFHSTNCGAGNYCETWFVNAGCDADLVCVAKSWSYDRCFCTVYTCYDWVCGP